MHSDDPLGSSLWFRDTQVLQTSNSQVFVEGVCT